MDATEIVGKLFMGGAVLPLVVSSFDAVVECHMLTDFLLGKPVLSIPFLDAPMLPPQDFIDAGVGFAAVAHRAGRKVLIKCTEGHNRSGLIVASYLMTWCNMAPEAAVALIREKRPGALTNQTFVNYLLALKAPTDLPTKIRAKLAQIQAVVDKGPDNGLQASIWAEFILGMHNGTEALKWALGESNWPG
jgi:Dual specificity phosphatase, catalytic domain